MTATTEVERAPEQRTRPTVRVPRSMVPIALGIALAATQAPSAAYTQNQNTYLVRALARSTEPALASDRLVRSTDPTPVFTVIARAAITLADGPLLLYGIWMAAAVAFFVALWRAVDDGNGTPLHAVVWAGIVGLVGGSALGLLDGTPLARPLEGVALQYALGPVLQPSTAGVLLVVGIAWAVRRGAVDWPVIATVFAAALIHPSYLPASWIVAVAAVGADLIVRAAPRAVALRSLGVAVAGTVVIALANITSYAASLDPEASEANRILAEQRVPHHALPWVWVGGGAIAMAALVVVAGLLGVRAEATPRRWLGTFLLLGTGIVVVATAIVWALGSPSLLLAFPWRASVCLVPIATAVLARSASEAIVGSVGRSPRAARLVVATALAGLSLAAATGLDTTLSSIDGSRRGPVVAALRDARVSGEGLIPTGRSLVTDQQVVDDIRANAGLPVYVDWKNNPNQPDAVLAWHRRLDEADAAMTDAGRLCQLVERHDLAWAALPPGIARQARSRCLTRWVELPAGDLILLVAPAHLGR